MQLLLISPQYCFLIYFHLEQLGGYLFGYLPSKWPFFWLLISNHNLVTRLKFFEDFLVGQFYIMSVSILFFLVKDPAEALKVYMWNLGKLSCNLRFMSSWAEDDPEFNGELWRIKSPIQISCFKCTHFLIVFLTLFTTDSAKPFDLGYLGLLVVCCRYQVVMNFQNVFDRYCDPLSETNSSGIPFLEKVCFNSSMTMSHVADGRRYISSHSE